MSNYESMEPYSDGINSSRRDVDAPSTALHGVDIVLTVVKAGVTTSVMLAAIVGNLLVIVSVYRSEKLRVVANSFIVSLAVADLMVGLLVMPFNASQEVFGRWYFGPTACSIFNANDVQFSTSSLLHLCCISVDRYIAIIDPFRYQARMNKRVVVTMLTSVWLASALLSHIPINLGWHSLAGGRDPETQDSENFVCSFEVNPLYGLISCGVSFWTPATVMVIAYFKIFREARRQEAEIYTLTYSVARCVVGVKYLAVHNATSGNSAIVRQKHVMVRNDHKAARTLGVIMGAFLVCWLPFFTWYLTSSLCSKNCPTPPGVVSILFWVGYFNSVLNPIIYAFLNRDFREAFHKILGCSATPRPWLFVDHPHL